MVTAGQLCEPEVLTPQEQQRREPRRPGPGVHRRNRIPFLLGFNSGHALYATRAPSGRIKSRTKFLTALALAMNPENNFYIERTQP